MVMLKVVLVMVIMVEHYYVGVGYDGWYLGGGEVLDLSRLE